MPVTELDLRAAQIAKAEWWYFGGHYFDKDNASGTPKTLANGPGKAGLSPKGVLGHEATDGFKERVWTYMKFGVYPDANSWQGVRKKAWSAAFISFCMRLAGARDNFPYSMGHWEYVNQAIRNRRNGKVSNTISAFAKDKVSLEVGDLIWRGRGGASGWTIKDIEKLIDSDNPRKNYESHCDLVVDVDRQKEHALVIGGNVSNRVTRLKVKISEDGLLLSKRFEVVVKNNIGEFVVA